LSSWGLSLTGALRFATPGLATAARKRSGELSASSLFADITIVEIGNSPSGAALDMAAALRRGGMLLTVFDEKTPYSVPVSLLGKQVWGGAGLDRFVRFACPGAEIWTIFMVRKENETYDMLLFRIAPEDSDPVATIYKHLESVLSSSFSQWYFLHEEIPFVK
jgi:hypothetical protein